jgi:ADP-ribose pyrophosphatase YjhB (NUDIX family)
MVEEVGGVEAGPPRRQRVAAYALLLRDGAILLARLSPHIAFQGWALPGGGVDHGEHPRDALRREIYEETGLHAEPGRLVDVHSTHFTGARPDGRMEDYHGIGLIFEAELLAESEGVEPHVTDVGGSTDLAAWVPLDDAAGLSLSGAARHALTLVQGAALHSLEEGTAR